MADNSFHLLSRNQDKAHSVLASPLEEENRTQFDFLDDTGEFMEMEVGRDTAAPLPFSPISNSRQIIGASDDKTNNLISLPNVSLVLDNSRNVSSIHEDVEDPLMAAGEIDFGLDFQYQDNVET